VKVFRYLKSNFSFGTRSNEPHLPLVKPRPHPARPFIVPRPLLWWWGHSWKWWPERPVSKRSWGHVGYRWGTRWGHLTVARWYFHIDWTVSRQDL